MLESHPAPTVNVDIEDALAENVDPRLREVISQISTHSWAAWLTDERWRLVWQRYLMVDLDVRYVGTRALKLRGDIDPDSPSARVLQTMRPGN